MLLGIMRTTMRAPKEDCARLDCIESSKGTATAPATVTNEWMAYVDGKSRAALIDPFSTDHEQTMRLKIQRMLHHYW